MGFYGNITNTSNTTFQFDRIYPNRLAMDANANNDGIFIGRYVLVEYDNKATISNIFVDTQHPVKTVDGEKYYYAYTTDNFTDINTRIQYKPNNRGENKNINVYFLGEFGQVQKVESNQLQQEYYTEFYQCVDSIISENDSTISYALFKYVTKSNTTDSEYIKNFAIDEAQYKEKKGYDSTVWTKASVKKPSGLLVTEYVRIADLNSVVPTFDLETDAPTMKPLVPHFDADSTNVYYKLHTQPQWGLRVAELENGKISDSKTTWISSTYNPETGQLIPSEDNGEHDAAIYFNRAAFLSQVDINRQTIEGIDKKQEDTQEKNYFTINPTGKSGNQYYLHTALDQNGSLQKVYGEAEDIQEMRINLPAIGNMMSDAWDIIHGPLRDNARTDENSSLQGRLDSFTKMEDNHIPMKRHEDGTLIGTAINGNQKYDFDGKNILTADNFPLTTNDPWIDVTIDNSSLQGGYDKKNKTEISQENNNAIRIRHSANKIDPTITSWDKNGIETSINNSYDYYNIDTNINGEQDKIKLYVPYVDATGHVVGKNIETVTLPYGYKTITTNGRGEDTEINTFDKVAAKTQNIVADNTQDELAINSGNEWIRIDTDAINDILTISHDIHKTSSDSHDTDWTQTEANTTIPTTTYEFDNAGHYVSHHTENYKLPFGYGKIVGDSGSTEATATYDEVKFTSDEWLTATIDKDTVTYSHDYPNVQEDTSTDFDMNTATTQDNKDKIVLETLRHDSTGHIINVNQHTVTLPYGYKTIKVTNNSNGVAAPASTVVEAGQSADQTQDTLNLNASNKWIVLDNAEDDIIKFGHKLSDLPKGWHSSSDTIIGDFGQSFKILKYETDEAGHVIDSGEDVITIPQGSYTAAIEASGSKEIITSIGFTPSSGAITSTKANTDTLSLSNYSANTNEYSKLIDIVDTDTINNAFKKIQNHINGLNLNVNEVADDTKIITSIVQKNGQVSLSRSTAGNLQIGTPSADGTIPANSSLNNAFNIINNRIKIEEDALAKEVQDRKDAITKEVSDRNTAIANAIAGIFDKNDDNEINKLAEIIEWINNNPSTATEMQAAIQSNTDAIFNEVDLARENEGKIASGLTEEIGRATTAEQGLQGQIEALQAWKETATDTISQLQTTIENLQKQIDDLKNPPQQPDEGGETV